METITATAQAADSVRELPLLPAQERLWFLDQLDPGDAAYNVYPAFRLRGPLVIEVLERALTEIARRHEPLRTRFPDVAGTPVQVVCRPRPIRVELVDLAELAGVADAPGGAGVADLADLAELGRDRGADWDQRVADVTGKLVNTGFDLANGPLFRVTVVRLAPDDHVLCLVLHHIISDGWSLNVLVGELATLYACFRAGRLSPLPDLPVRYGDHVLAEEARRSAGGAARSLDYWREQLADPPVLDLPTDRPRPPIRTSAGEVLTIRLPAGLSAAVETFARSQRCTLFMTLLAAYQVLLARHSGQDDLLVGSPIAGRDRVELEPLIGYFTNTLVLRADLTGNPTFAAFLRSTRGTLLKAFANPDVPLETLLSELRLVRDLSRTPLFQTLFVLHSESQALRPPPFGDLTIEPFDAVYRQSKFDLQLDIWRDDTGLAATFSYNVDLFDRATVERIAERYERLLAAVVADPQAGVWDIPLLADGERDQLLAWADGPVAAPEGALAAPPGVAATVPDLVVEQATRTPDTVAVACADRTLTYAELIAAAGDLATRLRAAGAGPGSIVGVCFDRSPELVVSLLGVWLAGAAYLPLDPTLPAERRDFLVEDSAATLVLTGAGVGPSRTAGQPAAASAGASVGAVTAAGGAYVIYTSGSTGQPKGVLVDHRALAARVRWMRDAYGLGAGDRVLQFASISFDTSAEELWPCLAAGGTVVLMPDGGALLPDFLATEAAAELTVLDLPTSYWHELVAQGDAIRWPRRLRLLILGGSELHNAGLDRWRRRFGDRVRLVNTYGPTETTIIATAAELTGLPAGRRPPIGSPIGATRVYILDGALRLVPLGVAGELCVGGAGVAVGYLGRPALTAERFGPDPFGTPGSRLYRTGDRAHWNAAGQLEFLGRLDGQVKLRGYRIEPAEVEAALRARPGVADAAVVVDGIGADARLVAYVVPAVGIVMPAVGIVMPAVGIVMPAVGTVVPAVGTVAPAGDSPTTVAAGVGTAATGLDTVAELRAALAGSLPSYLVPSAFVVLDRLPLTRNGKLDRSALPAPDPRTGANSGYLAPRTAAEELVAEAWAEVLGVERIGMHDDFFALGGHSLLATKVAAWLRAAVDLDVPVRTVFENPTIEALAAAVEALLVAEIAELTESEVEQQLGVDAGSTGIEAGAAGVGVGAGVGVVGGVPSAELE